MFDAIKRLFRNTVFRLSMVAAFLFALSSVIVLGYLYQATVVQELRRTDAELQFEIDELKDIFQEFGPQGMNREMVYRTLQPGRSLYVYQEAGTPPTYNIPAQPLFTDTNEKSLFKRLTDIGGKDVRKFTYIVEDAHNIGKEPVAHRARGRLVKFSPTINLFIARDVERVVATAERVTRALLISIGIALTLGLISGIFVSRRFAKRIEVFNKIAWDIRAGDLKKRLPLDDSGSELDDLAGHLNDMLDHIDRLMTAMRYAGDSIAHDLRSPLTRLQTRLESVGSEVDDEAAKQALFRASDDASELLKTFESVLRIARLEAGERREILVVLDPQTLLEDIAELYEPACEDDGLEFSMEIEGKHQIRADRGLLSQAVSNLVENAIKYTPSGGAITVRLRKIRSGRSEISVTDTGPGIPPKERERVKERFVRLEESRSEPGSGLGLALVDAIADLHRAKFELSDGPGGEGALAPGLRAALSFPRVKNT